VLTTHILYLLQPLSENGKWRPITAHRQGAQVDEDMRSINLRDPHKHTIAKVQESIIRAVNLLLKDYSHWVSCKSPANGTW
jgi:hypothetical protein